MPGQACINNLLDKRLIRVLLQIVLVPPLVVIVCSVLAASGHGGADFTLVLGRARSIMVF